MISLEGARALITGGASGIGAATAERLAQAGACGVCVDLNQGLELPARWHGISADVREEDAVRDAIVTATELLEGSLDIVVASAGVVPPWRHIDELDLDEWDNVFAINVRGVAATLKHATPRMSDGGSIVAVASLNAWRGDAVLAEYAASKHAVLGVVRSAAADLGPRGIRVNAVAPGPIATEALRSRMRRRADSGGPSVESALAAAAAQTSLGRIATAEDVADTVLFLCSDLARAITGQLLPVDGGLL